MLIFPPTVLQPRLCGYSVCSTKDIELLSAHPETSPFALNARPWMKTDYTRMSTGSHYRSSRLSPPRRNLLHNDDDIVAEPTASMTGTCVVSAGPRRAGLAAGKESETGAAVLREAKRVIAGGIWRDARAWLLL